jgi:uncharacterized phiE125 gp8 family phage protein
MYKLITQPSSEPITLEQAKAHLRVTGSEEDSLINNLIVAVRNEAESYLNRVLIEQVWDLYLDEFPDDSDDEIVIQKTPVTAITYIKYYDSAGVLQTWDRANYDLDHYNEPARVYSAYEVYYPAIRLIKNAVQIRFTCGYGEAGDVPEAIKSGMYLYLSYLYDNRGDQTTTGVPHAVWNIWNNYRILWL